jgi:hypothetical protein
MLRFALRLISAWPLVARRSLAHWRLLSTVVIGVLLASAIMSGTVIYFDALRELALENALDKLTADESNVVVKAERGPTSFAEYEKVKRAIGAEIDFSVGWMLEDRERGGRSDTFFLTALGREADAGQDDARAYFSFVESFPERVTVLPGGRLPQDGALDAPGQPLVLEAVVPAEDARLFGVGVGDVVSAVPHWEDAIPYARVLITGLFEKNDPSEEFWHLDKSVIRARTAGFLQTMGFYISETTFMEDLGGALRDMDSTYGWLLEVDTSRLNAGNASQAFIGLETMDGRMTAQLQRFRQSTSLDDALSDYDRRLFFSKIPMFVVLVLIAVVILYYVVTLSSLLVDQQRGEIALLRSRGASSGQILAVFVLEGLTISVIAIVAAPIVAATVIGVLGYTPAFSDLSGGGRLPVAISRDAYLLSTLGGLLSFAALIVPAIQASRIGVTRHRQQEARPAAQPFFQRYFLDVMLLVVGIILFRQLSDQGSVVATGLFGQATVSQLLLAVPALILVGLAMVLLRLFPLAIRFLSGDSPMLLHLTVGGTLIALVPSITSRGLFEGAGAMWTAQVALLALLGAVYWKTASSRRPATALAGMSAQGGLVAAILLLGPELPMRQVFVPLLVAIVPAQVTFRLLVASAHRLPVGYSIGMWQMARNPTHYARLSLLLILMAGLGIFAASFGGTLQLSFEQRALYSTGADVRVEHVTLNSSGPSRPVTQSYEGIPGVSKVARAMRVPGSDLSKILGNTYEMFAVEGAALGEIGWFRDDFSGEPMGELLNSLAHPSPPEGVPLPDGASGIEVLARPDRPHPSVVLDARIMDANGRHITLPLGRLLSGGWTEFSGRFDQRRRFGGPRLVPEPPLTLVSISVHEASGARTLRAGAITIDEVRATVPGVGAVTIENFDDSSGWNVLYLVRQARADAVRPSRSSADGSRGAATFIWTEGGGLLSRGIFYGPPVSPLPVLASESFLRIVGHRRGEEFDVSIAGHRVPVRIEQVIDYFPTMDAINDGFLIADLDSVLRYTNLDARGSELKPNEIWLMTQTAGADRRRLVQLLEDDQPFPNRVVHDRAEVLAGSQVDPLVDAGWRALLFIAFSTVLVLSAIGFLVHAYVSFRNREVQFALMRTIGFSMGQLVTLVWLEQALVVAAGMALGTWMGGRLGETIMPFLAHDERGAEILPPFALQVDWTTLAVTYAAMALVFAIITLGVILFIRKISLQRILRLGEM